MRGFIFFFITISLLVVYMVFAPAAIEGIGEPVKSFESVDSDSAETIDDIYTSAFVKVPLILLVGIGLVGVAWYIRRQRIISMR